MRAAWVTATLLLLVASDADAQARRPADAPWSRVASAPAFPASSGEAAGHALGSHTARLARHQAATLGVDGARAAGEQVDAALSAALAAAGGYRGPAVPLADRQVRARPVRGTVVHRGGARRGADTPTYVRSPGWTWRVSEGAEVSAIADGVVAWSGRIRGYGGVVVVWHAPGEHSVYTGLRSVGVARGLLVSRGDALGEGGHPSAHGGMEVSVEIRQDGVPVDPSPWLRP